VDVASTAAFKAVATDGTGAKNNRSRLLEQTAGPDGQWIHNLRSFPASAYGSPARTMQVLRRQPTEQYAIQQHPKRVQRQPQVIPIGCRTGWRTGVAT